MDAAGKNSQSYSQSFKLQKKGNTLQVKISANFLVDLIEIKGFPLPEDASSGDSTSKKNLCDSRQLMEDYAKFVKPTSQPWKPNLSTIVEAEQEYQKRFLLRLLSIG
eukprot:Gb_20007 [translate_table: standard]